MAGLPWLAKYSGETTQQLLALEGSYRTDSIVVTFERAIYIKLEREGGESLSIPKMVIVAIEALEREVNNGGYDQFFVNPSAQYAPIIVDALKRVDCPKATAVAQRAIEALELPELSAAAIEAAMQADNDERDAKLGEYDKTFFAYEEDLAGNLFRYIRANQDSIRIP
jgi:hypothetical protein